MQVGSLFQLHLLPNNALGRVLLFLFVSLLVVVSPQTASAAATYEVPESGLSFDARDSEPADRCTTGFGNALSGASSSEISFVRATEKVFYKNIATIGGQAINGMVTVTSLSGMETKDFGAGQVQTLSRLDKCDDDSERGLLELRFDSATAKPGEANFVITIDFYESGGTLASPGTAATLTNLKMNVEDVDANQFLEVDGFSAVRLAEGRDSTDVQVYQDGDVIDVGGQNSAALSMSASARRYHALGSSSSSDPVIEKDRHVVEVTYASTNSIVMKLGVYESGSGSFDLNFRGFSFQSDLQTSEQASPAVLNPAIHLDLQGRVTSQATNAPVLMEGEGLKPGSTYTLTLREPSRVIKSGVVSNGGRFSHLEALPPGLAPGSYTITLQAIGSNNETLVLTQSFRIAADGTFASIGSSHPTVAGGLATTGPNQAFVLGGIAASVLTTLVGVAILASRRRIESAR